MDMLASESFSPSRPHPIHRVSAPVELAALYEAEVQLIALARPAAPALHEAVEALTEFTWRAKVEVELDEDGRPEDADPLARLWPPELAAPHAAALTEELAAEIELFGSLIGAETVGARLVVGREPHCPRFHVDRVLARALCVLAGATTEVLADWAVDRRLLGHGAGGLEDERSGAIRDPSGLFSLERFELAVFKGEAWPGNEGRALVHRSPRGDSPRLLFTLDAL